MKPELEKIVTKAKKPKKRRLIRAFWSYDYGRWIFVDPNQEKKKYKNICKRKRNNFINRLLWAIYRSTYQGHSGPSHKTVSFFLSFPLAMFTFGFDEYERLKWRWQWIKENLPY